MITVRPRRRGPAGGPGRPAAVLLVGLLMASNLVWTGSSALGGPGTYADDFAQLDYDGSNGTLDWSSTPWFEELDGGDPASGLVKVVADPTYCADGNCLQLTGNGSVKDRAAVRPVDLSGAGYATLSYEYLRYNWWSCRVRVQSRPDAVSSWTTLASYPVSGGTDPAPIATSHPIPASDIAATTQIRFIVDEWCDPERFYVDNVLIDTDLGAGFDAYLLAGTGGASGGDDLLTEFTRTDIDPATNETDVGAGTGTTAIRGMDVHPSSGDVYAVAGGTVGLLHPGTGTFSAIGPIGSGSGSQGLQPMTDVNALAFDPTSGHLYAVENQPGVEDLLLRIDPATGAIVADAFGPGVDYVRIQAAGSRDEAQALAIESGTGIMFAGLGDDGNSQNQRIVTVDKLTGDTVTVGDTDPPILTGLDFDDLGNLWGTGYIRGTPSEQFVYEIDSTDAGTIGSVAVDNGGAYEAFAFFVEPTINQPPAADPIADQLLDEGDTVSLTASATDPDLPPDALSWTQDSGPGAVDGAGNYSWTTGEADGPGTYTVVLRVTDDGIPNRSATVSFDITVAEVADPHDYYLKGDGVPAASLTPAVPIQTVLPNYDPGRDAAAGTVIAKGGTLITEADPVKYQIWLAAAGPVVLEGPASIDFWSAMLGFNPTERGVVNIGLLDCEPSGANCSAIGQVQVDEAPWSGGEPGWVLKTASFGSVTHTVPPGRALAVMFVVDPTSGNDMWFAYDTVVNASGLDVTVGGNDPPTDIALAPAAITENVPADTTVGVLTASDADVADTHTYALVAGAGDGDNGRFTIVGDEVRTAGALDFEALGSSLSIRVEATDSGLGNLTYQESLTITLGDENEAPIPDPIADQFPDEGALVSLTATAADPDLPGDTLTWSRLSGPGAVDTSGNYSWTPLESDGPAIYSVVLQVADDGVPSLTGTVSFSVTVGEVNVGPVLSSPGDQVGGESDVVSLFVGAVDVDVPANTLTWSASGLPPGLTIVPATGEIRGTIDPLAAAGSPYAVTVAVLDNGLPALGDSVGFNWTVVDTNRSPVLDAVGDHAVDEQTPLTFTATGSDPDLDGLTFSLVGEPAGAAMTPGGSFSWTPTEAQGPGVYVFDVVLTDDGVPALSATETITVTVNEVNQPPTLDPIGSQSSAEGDTVSLSLAAADPDLPAQSLTFTSAGLPPGLSLNPTTGEIAGTFGFSASAGSPYVVDITLSDGGTPNRAVVESFVWSVADTNRDPVAVDDVASVAEDGGPLSIDVIANDTDIDGDTPTLTAYDNVTARGGTVTAIPGGGLLYTARANFAGTDTFDYTIGDGRGGTASATVTVTVTAVDDPPRLTLPVTATVDAGATLMYPVGFSDLDTPATSLRFFLGEGSPNGATISDGGVFNWTPGVEHLGSNPITVILSDGPSTVSGVLTVAVLEPPTPVDPIRIAPVGTQRIDEGVRLAFRVTASAPDGIAETLTYELVAGPAGATVDEVSGEFEWVPTEAHGPGTFNVVIAARSEGVAAEVEFQVAVAEVNEAPVVGRIGDRAVAPGGAVVVRVGASDPDEPANVLRYALVGSAPPGLAIDPNTGVITWTPADDQPVGAYPIVVVVTDGDPRVAVEKSFVVRVTAPEANERRERLIEEASRVAESRRPADEDAAPRLERTLVLMGRATAFTVDALRVPFIVLAAVFALLMTVGRVSLFPLISRGATRTGIVDWYDATRGFGYIRPEPEGKHVFVHRSALRRRQHRWFLPGQRVTFKSVRGSHRDYARRVRRLSE